MPGWSIEPESHMLRRIVIRKRCGRWFWYCQLCNPTACGATNSWVKTMENIARHCSRRRYHHEWVRRQFG